MRHKQQTKDGTSSNALPQWLSLMPRLQAADQRWAWRIAGNIAKLPERLRNAR